MTAYQPIVPAPEPIPGLDAGIGAWVEILRQHGVETYESCEGGEGHAYPEPTIAFTRIAYDLSDGFHAYAVAETFGLPVKDVRLAWSASKTGLVGPHWEIVFWRKVGDPKPFCTTLGEAPAEEAAGA